MKKQDKLQDVKNKHKLAIKDGELHSTHLTIQDIEWLFKQAESLKNIEKAWRGGSGEDIDVALQEAFK
jgi:hypothetical protein